MKTSLINIILKISVIVLTAMSISVLAQEQLRPLTGNFNLSVIPKNSSQNKKTTTVTPLNLPFFDDFSYAYKSPYPSHNNWIDSNAYVNTGFAINPITLGVATFDGLNKNGYPYLINAPVSYSGSADTLTSRHINLKSTLTYTYSPADSIFLTFYYQAEGFGEAPEADDSLCLDFFKPNQNIWKKVWGVKGYNPAATDTTFFRVRIPIADTAYCDSLFKFRFRNKATTSGSLDHWHIDYVQIKQNYFYYDDVIDDVSFAYNPSSFLKNYSVIPFRQYDETKEMASKFRNYIRNNFTIDKQSVYQYTAKDATGNPIPTDPSVTFPFPGMQPFVTNGYYSGAAGSPVFNLKPFPLTFTDSTHFTFTHVITTSGDLYRANDTLVHVQNFSNYYAYDDGSAEQAYYLNTFGALTAQRFTLNVFDTLKAVRIYFDPITEGNLVMASSFRLMVWNSSGNGPGSLILKDSLMYPTYLSGSHNLIPTYDLTSCLNLPAGTYYIGIKQTTNKGLNIGFDKNTDHKDALYYDIGNGWVQSSIPGSLMINPVMGCVDAPILIGLTEYDKNDKVKLFPNPAQDWLTISYPGNQLENVNLEVVSSIGETVFTKSIISNEQIDISHLSNGLYFIYLKGNNLNVSPKKLIISR
jgi:hypothetical protein